MAALLTDRRIASLVQGGRCWTRERQRLVAPPFAIWLFLRGRLTEEHPPGIAPLAAAIVGVIIVLVILVAIANP